MEIIALDAHKHYSIGRAEDKNGKLIKESRINHEKGAIRAFLNGFTKGSTVAVETIGNWYWIVDEIEDAGMKPTFVHARKAKIMMGLINKTDRLDVRGLNTLQRNRTLPEVWIPPAKLRDERDVPRTRMVFSAMRTRLKNRIHSVLDKYGLHNFEGVSDIFGKKNRGELERRLKKLPTHTQFMTHCLLDELDEVQAKIKRIEAYMKEVFQESEEIKYLQTVPGIGSILAVVIANEMGDVRRFAHAGRFAAYSGTTPRVKASGGRIRYGRLRTDVNRYLKWAFVEAASTVALHSNRYSHRHVCRLYRRLKSKKGHHTAVGAVARHLAEATYSVIKKQESYRERYPKSGFTKESVSALLS
ncbi:MAG: IS110 family transposase [Phycisphaerales bacterium]|jgi:transposase